MLFDTLTQFDRLGRDLFSTAGAPLAVPVDIRRDGERYVIDADLPGVDPKSVDVTVEGGSLTIRAERSSVTTKEESRWLVRERSSSTIVRRFTLGDDIDPDRITADYHDGVLSVVVPLVEGARRHKVAVTVGPGAPKALAGSSTGDPDQGKAPGAHSRAS